MGRRSTGTVEPLKGAIRLKFTFNGARRVKTLAMAPTAANLKAAQRTMADIQAAIANNSFSWGKFFPEDIDTTTETFKSYAEKWLETLTVEKSTRRSYRSALHSTWYPAFGDKALADIRYSDIARAIAGKSATASGKTVNNALIPLRKVFTTAMRDDVLAKDPSLGVENLSHQPAEPDPFERDEADAILAHMAKFPAQVANYFEFAFLTGMRPSEIIALRWGDVDWKRRTIRVERARVDWEEKGTKTNRVRDVDLSDAAEAVLKRQKAFTFLADGEIFHNPTTGRPWADEQVQRRRYWNPTLKALGYRQRDAYQTRHTFASSALMGGINPAYIAKQLGHANAQMLFKRYGRWIDGADKGAEAKKLNALLSRNRPRDKVAH